MELKQVFFVERLSLSRRVPHWRFHCIYMILNLRKTRGICGTARFSHVAFVSVPTAESSITVSSTQSNMIAQCIDSKGTKTTFPVSPRLSHYIVHWRTHHCDCERWCGPGQGCFPRQGGPLQPQAAATTELRTSEYRNPSSATGSGPP